MLVKMVVESPRETNMVSSEYLAGFFDGEACIRGAIQPSGVVVVSINISLKNPLPLRHLQNYFGVGTVALYPQCPPYKYYTFTAYSRNAEIILSSLFPFLIVKKEEAALALEALTIAQDKTKELSVPDKRRLRQIFDELREIKRRPAKKEEILEMSLDLVT